MFARPLSSICATILLLLSTPPDFAQSAAHASVVSPVVAHRFLVGYRGGVIPVGAAGRIGASGAQVIGGERQIDRLGRLGIVLVQAASLSSLERLAHDPAVLVIVQDRLVTGASLHARPAPVVAENQGADALYHSPHGWAVRQVGGFGDATLAGPWNATRGAGVRIAILDSGVDATHADLAPNLGLNLSEIDQSAQTGLPSVCDDGSAQDQTGHGSWTASLAAGAYGEGTGLVAGVAPAATLLNIKVLERVPSETLSAADPTGCIAGEATGLLSWVLQGIDDAVTARADIISMSLGSVIDLTTGDGAGMQVLFNQVTYAATQAGAVLIAAAGNDDLSFGTGASAGRYIELPAQARGVLAIEAATNPDCAEALAATATCAAGASTLPYYSNRGPALAGLTAPGGSYPQGAALDNLNRPSGWVTGACVAGGRFGCFNLGASAYVEAMGTSASAALAAGAAALVRAAHPEWSAAEVVSRLRRAAIAAPGLPDPMIAAQNLVSATPWMLQPPSIDLQPLRVPGLKPQSMLR
jgi:subtilisin family serine protease